jgi:hypothetical protein
MAEDIERKLSEQDKALAAELGRRFPESVRHIPDAVQGRPRDSPDNKEKPNGGAERFKSLPDDQEKNPKGTLASQMKEQREKQGGARDQTRTHEQGRER